MGSPLRKLAIATPDSLTNEDGFRLMIETHRGFLRQDGRFEVHTVDQHQAFKYQYDLYGYLASMKIHPEYHFATMRMSDIEVPTAFDASVEVLYIPTKESYTTLKGLYATSRGKVLK
jgi:hypothetical protein